MEKCQLGPYTYGYTDPYTLYIALYTHLDLYSVSNLFTVLCGNWFYLEWVNRLV